MDTLFKLLTKFDGRNAKSEEDLISMFEEIAARVLCGGYFLINGSAKIYPTDIEFYYHNETEEDKGFNKDYGMYHIGDEEDIPYFPVGSIYPHNSGVDVRFENEAKKFRASFLIREYRFEYPGYKPEDTDLPTQLWEDMFGYCNCIGGNLVITWIDDELEESNSLFTYERKNLRKYKAQNQPEMNNGEKVFDTRKRRFRIKSLKDTTNK